MPPRTPSLFSDPSPAPNPDSVTTITAHCDGGARGNPGPSGYGAEITDAKGNVVAELSEFLGIRTNNFAEYSGLLASLQYALDHGHTALRVISDSLLMVKQIQGSYKVKSPDLIPLWGEAKRRIARLDHFEITHALRHKNKAADRLANQAMDRGMNRGTPAEGRPLLSRPERGLTSQSGVASLPLRATPHPTQATLVPATAVQIDPAPQRATARTHAPILLTPELTPEPRAKLPRTAPDASSPPPATTDPRLATMLRGFVRNGAIQILGSEKLPDGIFVKIIPE